VTWAIMTFASQRRGSAVGPHLHVAALLAAPIAGALETASGTTRDLGPPAHAAAAALCGLSLVWNLAQPSRHRLRAGPRPENWLGWGLLATIAHAAIFGYLDAGYLLMGLVLVNPVVMATRYGARDCWTVCVARPFAIIVAASLVVFPLGLVLGNQPPTRFISAVGIDVRYSGLAAHPNVLGLVAAVVIISYREFSGRFARGVALLGGSFCLIASESRSALLALAVAALLLYARTHRREQRVLALSLMLLLGGSSGYLVFSEEVQEGDRTEVAGTNGRDDLWLASVRGVADAPMVGHGDAAWSDDFKQTYLAPLRRDPGFLEQVSSSHQMFLDAATRFGIAIAVLLVGGLAAIIAESWRRRNVVLLGAASIAFWDGLFESGLTAGRLSPQTILAVGLAATACAVPRARPRGAVTPSDR